MGAANKALVEVQFSDGTTIADWEAFSLRDTYTDPLGALDFVARPPRKDIPRYFSLLRKGELVGVKVGKRPIATPVITTVRTTLDDKGVSFEVQAHSVLSLPMTGSVDPEIAKSYNTDTPVSTVVLEALAPYGFETIEADTAGSVAAMTGKAIGRRAAPVTVDALKHKDAQAREGETAYAFCSRIFSRLGVCLRVDHLGHLLLGAPDYDQEPAYTLVQDADRTHEGDRMLAPIEVIDTNDGLYSEVIVRGRTADQAGQTRTATPGVRLATAGLTRPAGAPFADLPVTTQPALRCTYRGATGTSYRPRFALDKDARDQVRCLNVAKLIHGQRAAQGFVVDCAVDGLVSTTGRVWAVDTVARVVIDALGIDESLWIFERTLQCSRNEGQTTRLRLIPKGALTLGDVPA